MSYGYFKGNQQQRPQQRKPDIDYFNQVEKDYATTAENAIKNIKTNSLPSTSSIRNILALINNVSMKVANCQENALPQDVMNDISYLKVRLAYIYGRGQADRRLQSTSDFIDRTKLLELLLCVDTKKKYEIFAKYVEALIAYHKYYGGKDK